MKEELRYMSMSRSVMNGLQEEHPGTSSVQSDVLTNVTNMLDRVTKTELIKFKCGRANRHNARTSTKKQAGESSSGKVKANNFKFFLQSVCVSHTAVPHAYCVWGVH